ncbi:MAG: hypothetical protein HY721_14620 [Planctomycetes bacterium]|nr:hypothetical protein [Planctomycetota bacterium]
MQLAWRRKVPGPRRFSPERLRALEHLDRPDLDPEERRRSYADLDTIARLPGQSGPLWRAVRRLARRHQASRGGPPLRLLELGAGTGALGLRLAARLAARGARVELVLTDLRAEQLPPGGESGRLKVVPRRLDALRDAFPETDIAFANLLIHHFAGEEARALLERMRGAARLGGAVYDLDRNAFAFRFVGWTFPLWVRSPVTASDALASVQQAFRTDELLRLARDAGIEAPRARRIMGLRNLLWWEARAEAPRIVQPGV